jgi:hypothetical protein
MISSPMRKISRNIIQLLVAQPLAKVYLTIFTTSLVFGTQVMSLNLGEANVTKSTVQPTLGKSERMQIRTVDSARNRIIKRKWFPVGLSFGLLLIRVEYPGRPSKMLSADGRSNSLVRARSFPCTDADHDDGQDQQQVNQGSPNVNA